MYSAAIKTRNMVVELNIQQVGGGEQKAGAALVTGWRLKVSGPSSRFLKKKNKNKNLGKAELE